MKIVLPVGGRGYRFQPLTHWLPKCVVPVRQRPLAAWAVANLDYRPHQLILVANERERHLLDPAFDAVFDRKAIRVWTQDTAGAAHTVLKAREHIDCDEELLIVTPDLVWSADLAPLRRAKDIVGGLVVTDAHRKEAPELRRSYSCCDLNDDGTVKRVVEKPDVEMDWANIGVYWWRTGGYFCTAADGCLKQGRTVNGEFYIAPVYNYALKMGWKLRTVPATEYVNLGSAQRAAEWEGWR